MKPAQHASFRARVIVLHKRSMDTGLCVVSLVVALKKKTSIVTKNCWLDDDNAFEFRLNDIHA